MMLAATIQQVLILGVVSMDGGASFTIRKHALSGQVAADGSIKIFSGTVDSASELSPVRKASEEQATTDGRVESFNDLADSTLQISHAVRTTERQLAVPDRSEISTDLVRRGHMINIADEFPDRGTNISNIGRLLQWSFYNTYLFATIIAVVVCCFMWIGMLMLESGLERRNKAMRNAASGHCSSAQRNTSTRWRMMQATTDIFASPDEQARLDTRISLRKLRVAVIATGLMTVVTLVASHAIGSLSLCGDGIHLLGDTLGYFGLFLATVASQWGSDESFTFGLARVELLCVLAAVAFQYHEASNVAYEAYLRFWNPKPLDEDAGMQITFLSCLSMCVNLGLVITMSSSGKSCGHNHGDSAVGMVLIHIMCDLCQNAIVIVTGVVLWCWPRFYIIDSICVLFFLILLSLGTLPQVWDILRILLEASPGNIDFMQLRKDLLNIKGVIHIQNFHVWCITPGRPAVIAHIYADCEPTDVLQKAECIVKHKYGVQHFTFQISDDEPF